MSVSVAHSRQRPSTFVYHINTNGMGPRLEELQAAASMASIVSLQDTRLRDRDRAESLWRSWWPDFAVHDFLHDDDGPGCALLIRSSLQHRLVTRYTED